MTEMMEQRMDPTARGDAVAAKVREWYEANRESWWDRHRPQIFSYRDNGGVVADNFAIGLVAAVHAAEAAIHKEYER